MNEREILLAILEEIKGLREALIQEEDDYEWDGVPVEILTPIVTIANNWVNPPPKYEGIHVLD